MQTVTARDPNSWRLSSCDELSDLQQKVLLSLQTVAYASSVATIAAMA
jgi:hypothetical protein